MNPKQRAAEAALKYVESGMVVGLGTGSTADQFLQALARALAAGKVTGIRGVPTSVQSERRARDWASRSRRWPRPPGATSRSTGPTRSTRTWT
jgi:ribose 5-phosphate isomerase